MTKVMALITSVAMSLRVVVMDIEIAVITLIMKVISINGNDV